jgi:hypothetical protein
MLLPPQNTFTKINNGTKLYFKHPNKDENMNINTAVIG